MVYYIWGENNLRLTLLHDGAGHGKHIPEISPI